MTKIEIYWNDLTRATQKEIQQMLGLDENDNNNWDLIPMATLEIEDDEREYDEPYTPSSTAGDYSPSNPWDAPGMIIHDFI